MHRPRGRLAAEWLESQYLIDHPVRATSAYALRRSLAVFETWLTRPADLADLTDANLSRWLMDREKFYAPASLKRMRGDLLGIRRHAADAGQCDWPRKVRAVKVPRKAPRGIRRAVVQELIAACAKLPERRHGTHLGTYFAALIGAAWYTGLRRGDLFGFDLRELDESGVYPVTQHKTGEVVWRWIDPATVKRLRELGGTHPLKWRGAMRGFYLWFDKVKLLAGVTMPGYLQMLRRSAASDVERQQPGAARGFLGHLTPGLAERNYIDRSIAYGKEIGPESLE